jgi:hypothetical protein
VLIGATLALVLHGGVGRPSPASAAEVLRRAAAAALPSPPTHLAPGQFWYSENVGTYLDYRDGTGQTVGAYVSETETYWVGVRGWIRRDKLRSVRAENSSTPKAELRDFGPNPSLNEHNNQADLPVSYAQLLSAPTSTAGLTRFVLRAETRPGFHISPKYRTFLLVNSIHDILIEPMVPGRLRSALFRVAATIPGARMIGAAQDSLGRAAVEIDFDVPDQHTRYEFLFDPTSYVLTDMREVNIDNPKQLYGDTAFIASGLVNHVGAAPVAKPGPG